MTWGGSLQSISPTVGEERTNDEGGGGEKLVVLTQTHLCHPSCFHLGGGGEPGGGGSYKYPTLSTNMCCTFWVELPITCPQSLVRG